MVVVLGVVAHALVAHHRLAGLHTLHQPQPLQLVEDAVDARAAHTPLRLTQRILDLDGRKRARLRLEQLQHRAPRAAALVARFGQRRLGALDPAVGRAHEPPACPAGARSRDLRVGAHPAMLEGADASTYATTARPMIAVLGGSEGTA